MAVGFQEVKKHVKGNAESYLKENMFSFLCIGSYGLNGRVSGAIGKSRAKRLIHLVEKASDDGVVLLLHSVQGLESASKLKTFLGLEKSDIFKEVMALEIEPTKEVAMAREVLTWFLNVINFPAKDFKDELNGILSQFSFESLQNSKADVTKRMSQLHEKMSCHISSNCVSQRMR